MRSTDLAEVSDILKRVGFINVETKGMSGGKLVFDANRVDGVRTACPCCSVVHENMDFWCNTVQDYKTSVNRLLVKNFSGRCKLVSELYLPGLFTLSSDFQRIDFSTVIGTPFLPEGIIDRDIKTHHIIIDQSLPGTGKTTLMLKSIAAATTQLGLGINEVRVLMVTPRRTFAYNKLMELHGFVSNRTLHFLEGCLSGTDRRVLCRINKSQPYEREVITLPQTSQQMPRNLLVFTPTITVGVNFNVRHFDSAFIYTNAYKAGPVVRDLFQRLHRSCIYTHL
ncbi:hypothetical protein WJX77_012707 [Trebouxia sp. C0004]